MILDEPQCVKIILLFKDHSPARGCIFHGQMGLFENQQHHAKVSKQFQTCRQRSSKNLNKKLRFIAETECCSQPLDGEVSKNRGETTRVIIYNHLQYTWPPLTVVWQCCKSLGIRCESCEDQSRNQHEKWRKKTVATSPRTLLVRFMYQFLPCVSYKSC